MYKYVKGTLTESDIDSIVVEASGVGYNLFVTAQTLNKLPDYGSEIKVYTYLVVREDAMILYGFLSKDELAVFKNLISVNGVGPKGAIGILSVLSTNELRFAVAAGDSKAISKAPGVGAKTAQRIILELKDKLKLEDALENNESVDNSTSEGNPSQMNRAKEEAIMALTALGFSSTESLKAVSGINITPEMESDDILKAALKHIS